jgi:hypothetical protein
MVGPLDSLNIGIRIGFPKNAVEKLKLYVFFMGLVHVGYESSSTNL